MSGMKLSVSAHSFIKLHLLLSKKQISQKQHQFICLFQTLVELEITVIVVANQDVQLSEREKKNNFHITDNERGPCCPLWLCSGGQAIDYSSVGEH